MTKYFATAVAIAFVTTAAPGLAQAPDAADKPAKKLSTQQQKMKDCGAKWKEEKAAKNLKGREAYRKFIGDCLKKG
jgi:hypothetical protein